MPGVAIWGRPGMRARKFLTPGNLICEFRTSTCNKRPHRSQIIGSIVALQSSVCRYVHGIQRSSITTTRAPVTQACSVCGQAERLRSAHPTILNMKALAISHHVCISVSQKWMNSSPPVTQNAVLPPRAHAAIRTNEESQKDRLAYSNAAYTVATMPQWGARVRGSNAHFTAGWVP